MFLTSIVTGFELGSRIGRALHGHEMLSRGWHSVGVCPKTLIWPPIAEIVRPGRRLRPSSRSGGGLKTPSSLSGKDRGFSWHSVYPSLWTDVRTI